jgi:hypothetical protein
VTKVTAITVTDTAPETETIEEATEAAKMTEALLMFDEENTEAAAIETSDRPSVTTMVNFVSAETRETSQNMEADQLKA